MWFLCHFSFNFVICHLHSVQPNSRIFNMWQQTNLRMPVVLIILMFFIHVQWNNWIKHRHAGLNQTFINCLSLSFKMCVYSFMFVLNGFWPVPVATRMITKWSAGHDHKYKSSPATGYAMLIVLYYVFLCLNLHLSLGLFSN